MEKNNKIQQETNENQNKVNGGGIGKFLLFFGGLVALLVLLSLILDLLKG